MRAQDNILYPNPVDEELHILLDGYSFPVRIRLVDRLGKTITEFMSDERREYTIDFSKLSAGVYILYVDGKAYRIQSLK